jgi:hypothetical protein
VGVKRKGGTMGGKEIWEDGGGQVCPVKQTHLARFLIFMYE